MDRAAPVAAGCAERTAASACRPSCSRWTTLRARLLADTSFGSLEEHCTMYRRTFRFEDFVTRGVRGRSGGGGVSGKTGVGRPLQPRARVSNTADTATESPGNTADAAAPPGPTGSRPT